VTVKTLDFSFE